MNNLLSKKQIWGAPLIMALLCAAGLSSALLADGFWDLLSWISLGIPVLVCFFYYFSTQRRNEAKDAKSVL